MLSDSSREAKKLIYFLPEFQFWPEAERKEELCFPGAQQRLQVPGDQLVVAVGGEELEVLVDVLIAALVLPDVDKLVLVPHQHTEVTQAAPVQNIFVGVYKTCEWELSNDLESSLSFTEGFTLIGLLILEIFIDCVRFDRMSLNLNDPLLLAQLVRVTALLLLDFSLKESS